MNNLPAFSYSLSFGARINGAAGLCLFLWMTGAVAYAQTPAITARPAQPSALQPIEALLLTPTERQTLDTARAIAARSATLAPNGTPIDTGLSPDLLYEPPKEALQSVTNPLLAIDGVVVREGKKSTLWLNGQALYGAGPGSPLRDKAMSSGIARAVPGGFVVQGKPGEVWDTDTGTRTDMLPKNAIQIQRPAARKP